METVRWDIYAFETSTKHLSLMEVGAYSQLLRQYYWNEKPFPNDIKAICRMAGAYQRIERNAVERVLKEFFYLDGDVVRHRRADREIEKAKTIQDKWQKRQAGLKAVAQ